MSGRALNEGKILCCSFYSSSFTSWCHPQIYWCTDPLEGIIVSFPVTVLLIALQRPSPLLSLSFVSHRTAPSCTTAVTGGGIRRAASIIQPRTISRILALYHASVRHITRKMFFFSSALHARLLQIGPCPFNSHIMCTYWTHQYFLSWLQALQVQVPEQCTRLCCDQMTTRAFLSAVKTSEVRCSWELSHWTILYVQRY